MAPVAIEHFTAVSGLGQGRAAHLESLRAGRSGLAPCRFETVTLDTWVAEVASLPELPVDLRGFDCRNHRLAEAGLRADGFADAVAACVARTGAARVGLVLGTSTSGILETEQAWRRLDAHGALPTDFSYPNRHNLYALARYCRRRLGLAGPATVISTACSSSAKVFACASRWIAAGLIDAAVVGGVDSLCLTTLYGFHSLQLTAPGPCRPFDAGRDGISIGEAAAFALLLPVDSASAGRPLLLGCGESNDAHHMSAPHPEGLGARLAMQAALEDAGLAPGDIDYLNLHGTGTPANDLAEARAVAAVFGDRIACSSTKGVTGHCLGAAGALEAAICLIALEHAVLPGSPMLREPDPRLPVQCVREARDAPLRRAMSNSFGFGGSNCALVFGAAEAA